MPANEPVDHRRNVEQADMRIQNVETQYLQAEDPPAIGNGRYIRRGIAALGKVIFESFLFGSAGTLRVCTDVQPDNDTGADSYGTADGAGTYPRLQYGETCRLTLALVQGVTIPVDIDLRVADRLIEHQQYTSEAGRAIYTANLNLGDAGTAAADITVIIGIDPYFAGDELGALDRGTEVPPFDFHPLSPFYNYAAGTFVLEKAGGGRVCGWLFGTGADGPGVPFELLLADGTNLGGTTTLALGDILHLEGHFPYARFVDPL